MRLWKKLLSTGATALAVWGLSGPLSAAEIVLSASTYLENFNSMGTSSTASIPTGWTMSVKGATPTYTGGSNITAVTQQASSGSPNTGGTYNWGNGTTTSDRALGFMTSGSYASPNNIMVGFNNSLGGTITKLTLTFDYERYRINNSAAAITFFTSTDGSAWTAQTLGDSGAFSTGTSAYDFTSGTVVNKSFDLTGLSIANGSKIYLRWNFNTTGSNSQGLGLDNFSLLATTGGSGQTTNYFGATGQGGATVWNTTSANWSGNISTGPLNNVTWNATLPTHFGGTAGSVSIGNTTVSPQAGIYFDSSGYTLTGNSITLVSSSTVNVSVNCTATIASKLSGTVGLTKGDAGTLVLTNASNDFTGNVSVANGVLSIAGNSQLGNAANPIVLGGGTLRTTASISTARSISGSAALDIAPGTTLTSTGAFGVSGVTLSNTGTLALNGVTPSVGVLTFSAAGAIQNNSGTALAAGNLTTTHTAGTATITGPLNLGAGATRGVTVADGASDIDLQLSGALSGNAVLLKAGPGTLKLTGNNSGLVGSGTIPCSIRQGVAGATPTSGGVIAVDNANALGSGQLQLNGGTLRNDSGALLTFTNANGISTGAQDHANTPGGLVFSGADLAFSGNLAVYRATGTTYQHAITVNNTTTVGGLGAPTGTGNSTGLTVAGTGKLILNADSSTVMNLATTLQNSVTLEVNHNFYADVTVNGGSALAGSGTVAGSVHFNSTANSSFAGTIGDGASASSVTKDGSGVATLSGTNSYTGTTVVNAGILRIANTGLINSTSGITVNGGTLDYQNTGTALSAPVTNVGGTVLMPAGTAITVAAGSNFAGYRSLSNTGSGLNSQLALLGGHAGASNAAVSSAWRVRNAAEGDVNTAGNPDVLPAGIHNLISDVTDFNGTGSELYVMQLSYDPAQIWNPNSLAGLEDTLASQGMIYLAWNNGGKYENAGTGVAPTVLGAYDGNLTVGNWGVDTSAHVAWAVINHNSQFAVVPEPGTLALLAFGSLAVLRVRRSKAQVNG